MNRRHSTLSRIQQTQPHASPDIETAVQRGVLKAVLIVVVIAVLVTGALLVIRQARQETNQQVQNSMIAVCISGGDTREYCEARYR